MINLQNHLDTIYGLINNYLTHKDKANGTLIYKSPADLRKTIDFAISEKGSDFDELIKNIEKYLKFSVNTANPQFFNQLYGGFNWPAFLGELITALSNTSMYTYEVAPVATLIEMEMIKKMCAIVAYKNGDGIFVTGGSNANLTAMLSARNRLFPSVKSEGMYGLPKLSLFISEHAHYSFEINANVLGIGTSQIYKIKSDAKGRMLPDMLEKQINSSLKKEEKPFFIGATAGTTLLGAFDPIDKIAKTAEKHNIWLHVDGSFGGSLILSPKTKPLFKGIEKTDSIAWNPHKLMNIPLVCSVILINEKNRLYKNLSRQNDDYIFHKTESAGCDLGKKSIQCGRKVDALKLWLSWKYYGDEGYTARMNNLLHIAEYFESKILEKQDFELLAPRQSLTVCFRYVPKQKNNIDKANKAIRETLRKSGKSIVNYGSLNGQFAFRWVVANAETSQKDVDLFFKNFNEAVKKLKLS